MTNISDADLMAYADGVLPRHLRPLVRQALLRDPELLEKLESYIITNRGLAAPFDRLPPVPDRLRKMLTGGDPSPNRRLWPLLLRSVSAAKLAERFAMPVWSLAAVALLLCAAVLTWGLRGKPQSAPELADLEAKGLVASAQFQRALETTESNVPAQLAVLRPSGTFLSTQNEWCRQYELVNEEATRLIGVACRDKGGAWQVKTSAQVRAPQQPNGYAPAGVAQSEAKNVGGNVETVVDRLMKDVVLLPSDERKLIADGWQLPR